MAYLYLMLLVLKTLANQAQDRFSASGVGIYGGKVVPAREILNSPALNVRK
jgi:hypothetical protein